jgi:hypothetical protein
MSGLIGCIGGGSGALGSVQSLPSQTTAPSTGQAVQPVPESILHVPVGSTGIKIPSIF